MAKKLRRALVVGSGRAGLTAASTLASQGVAVLLLSKSPALGAQSTRDHEGINALGVRDSQEQLSSDTWQESRTLASRAALGNLGRAAADIAPWLVGSGVPFTRDARGQLAHASLSGSCVPRTLFVSASTGRHLVAALDAQLRGFEDVNASDAFGAAIPGEKLVRRLDHWRLVDLVLDDDGRAVGVVAQDCRTLAFKAFAADGIVLASGGYGGLFDGAACNASCLGVPLGVAYRHGAVLANLEFVEPCPTVIAAGPARVALPEWLRWLGGRVWVTTKAQNDPREVAEKDRRYPFEKKVGSLLDAARATQALLDAGAAPGDKGRAFLDLTHLEPDRLSAVTEALGGTIKNVFGLDVTRSPLPVAPCIHYTLGGLWVDSDAQSGSLGSARQHSSSVPGLYGAGEACHQYHGAHALAGNRALGDLVGGRAAAQGVVAYRNALEKSAFDLPNSVFDRPQNAAEKAFDSMLLREGSETSAARLLGELRVAMASGCGLERDADGLEALLETLSALEERAHKVAPRGPTSVFNPEAVLASELPDVLLLSRAVVSAALGRDESRGTHVRLDREASPATTGRSTFVRAGDESDAEIIESFDYLVGGNSVSIGTEVDDGE